MVVIKLIFSRLQNLVILFSLILVGCGNPLGGSNSLIQNGHHPGVDGSVLPPSKGTEFVSSSAQMKPTIGGKFIIQDSLSSATDQILQTTSGGHKLYSNVQGELISSGVGP